MKIKTLLGILAMVAVCGCQGGNASTQRTTTGKANDTSGTPVTLVGCLVPGNVGTAGTSGNTGAAGFTLIDVTTTSAAPGAGAASGAAATPETSATGTAGRSYSLVGDKDRQDDMQKYLNSRVEVTGLAVTATDSGPGAPDAGSGAAPAGSAGAPAADMPRVRVRAVRQVENSCR